MGLVLFIDIAYYSVNTSSGILRLYDRFDALGVQYTVQPLVRLLLVSLAWMLDGSMFMFLLAWGLRLLCR